MKSDVKMCVDTRVNFFSEYLIVPQELQSEVDTFIQNLNILGEACTDTAEFEARFISEGHSDIFNALIPRCGAKDREMTAEEKKYSKELAREMGAGGAKAVLGEVTSSVADVVTVEAESQVRQQLRKQMIEDGSFRDYTVATNYIEDAVRLGKFFKNKFKKKK